MNKRQKGLIILFTPFILGFLLGFIVRGGCTRNKEENNYVNEIETISESTAIETTINNSVTPLSNSDIEPEVAEETEPQQVIYYRSRLQYANLFADQNEVHLEAAKKLGLNVVPKVRKQVETSSLVLIEENDNLVVDNLRYSIPYLTKGAADELNRIAKAFADSLSSKGFPKYRLIVSSVLRTEEDVNRLRRSGNPNASINSAHCYGTTFDITYTRYEPEDETYYIMHPFELTKVLGEVLLEEKRAGRILAKYERKEHCFHITAK